MKKELLFAFGAFFLMSLHAIAGNSLTEPPQTETMTIKTYKKDVTGDGKRDTIKLNAIPYEPDALFLKQIWATISTSEGSKLRIDYEGGYNRKLLLQTSIMTESKTSYTGRQQEGVEGYMRMPFIQQRAERFRSWIFQAA